MLLNRARMWAGIAALTVFYFVFPRQMSILSPADALEAMAFSTVVLVALGERRPGRWLVFLILSALINLFVYLQMIPPIFLIRELDLLPAPFNRGQVERDLVSLVFVSLAGVVYCALLHLLVRPVFLSARTYLVVAGACSISAIPFVFDLHDLFEIGETWRVSLHKVLWFVMFGVALSESVKRTEAKTRREVGVRPIPG
jgi:hypothetical protein